MLAALLWASYYYFILAAPDAHPGALLAGPFLAGAVGFLAAAWVGGHASAVPRLFTDPTSYLRAALLVGMQVGVLAATYLTGAVDTSLLSLVGDVVCTPILIWVLYREGGARFRSLLFVGGMVLSTLGAGLVIAGGSALRPITGWAWVAAPAVPIVVALYFLFTAKTSQRVPMTALVGQATLLATLFAVAISPALPGGLAGLVPPNAVDLALIIGVGLTSFYLGPYLYFLAVEKVGLVLPALLMTAIPVFTVLLGVLVDRTLPPWLSLAGIPVATLGAILALRGPHEPWGTQYARRAARPTDR